MADIVRPVLPNQAVNFAVVSVRIDLDSAQQTVLQDLVSSAYRGVVVVWPVLDKCKVSILCIATTKTVLVLKNVRVATRTWRTSLQNTILCNAQVRVVGLDFGMVAYSLFSDLKCHISRGVDVHSALSPKAHDACTIMEELLIGKAPKGAALKLFREGKRKTDTESLAVARAYVLAHTMLSEQYLPKILAVEEMHLASSRRFNTQVGFSMCNSRARLINEFATL